MNYHFVKMLKPLSFDVKSVNGVIPAGTKNVEIAFRQALWTYETESGKRVRGNVYRHNGVVYH